MEFARETMRAFHLATPFADRELERSILQTLVEKPGFYWQVVDLLAEGSFVYEGEKWAELVSAIVYEKPMPSGFSEASTLDDLVQAAKQLSNLQQLRMLASFGQGFLKVLERAREEGDVSALSLITEVEEQLSAVQYAVKELRAGQVFAFQDVWFEVYKEIEERWHAVQEHGSAVFGLPSGIHALDRLLGGLQPGIHLLAGEPGTGKTTFALQLAGEISRAGHPVLFVSFEEPIKKLAFKAMCQVAGLKMKRYFEGQGSPLEMAQLGSTAHTLLPALGKLHFVEGNSRLAVPHIKAKALQVMTRTRSERCLIVIDYIQRWASTQQSFSDFRHVVTSLVSELRELSLRLESPILAISSQNRTGQGKALLTSLKESGDLEYSADSAMFLVNDSRDVVEPLRAVSLCLEKNRYGDRGRISLDFDPETGRLDEVFRREEG